MPGAANDGQQAEQLLRLVGQALDTQEQGLTQAGRQGAEAVGPGREELLGEKRVAVAARVHTVDHPTIGGVAEDVGDLVGKLVAVEPIELDTDRPRRALELTQQRS